MSDPLLPPNATPAERALALAVARLSAVPVPLADLWHPAACPAAVLPWLAWALSVDHWEPAWSAAVKRAVVAASLQKHAQKGTPGAVERALMDTGAPNARVVEWWEYAALPYHFRVEIELAEAAVSGELEARLTRTVTSWQNLRSHFDGFIYQLACTGPVPAFAAGLASGETVTLYPP